MEALIISSRSVNQDKFFQKDQENKYEKHISQISQIQKKSQISVHQWEEEVESMAESRRKAKSAAKNFRVKEDQGVIKKQNMKLLKKIWTLEPAVDTFNSDKYQYVSGSNWSQYKRNQECIKEENKKIKLKVLLQKVEVKDYKKKLKEQIKDYIERRNSIRKVRGNEQKPKRAASQTKQIITVKLQKSSTAQQTAEKSLSKEVLPKLIPEPKKEEVNPSKQEEEVNPSKEEAEVKPSI